MAQYLRPVGLRTEKDRCYTEQWSCRLFSFIVSRAPVHAVESDRGLFG